MSISSILLAVTLILLAINLFQWFVITAPVIAAFALVTGIAILLEGLYTNRTIFIRK